MKPKTKQVPNAKKKTSKNTKSEWASGQNGAPLQYSSGNTLTQQQPEVIATDISH